MAVSPCNDQLFYVHLLCDLHAVEQVHILYSVIGVTDPFTVDKLPRDGYLLEAARLYFTGETQKALCKLGLSDIQAEILTKFMEGKRSIERYIHISNPEKKED